MALRRIEERKQWWVLHAALHYLGYVVLTKVMKFHSPVQMINVDTQVGDIQELKDQISVGLPNFIAFLADHDIHNVFQNQLF